MSKYYKYQQHVEEKEQLETPRFEFETPIPKEKKKRKSKEQKKLIKPPMLMKKFASMQPGFSNSQLMSNRIKGKRETESAPIPP